MKLSLALFFCFILTGAIHAQEIYASESIRYSMKAPRIEIVGANDDGVVLRNYGPNQEMIYVFNQEMNLVWSRKIELSSNHLLPVDYLLNKKGAILFYTERKRNQFFIGEALVNSKYTIDNERLIDTIQADKQLIVQSVSLIHSENNLQHAVVVEFEADGIRKLHCAWLGSDALLSSKNEMNLSESASDELYYLLTNTGNFYVLSKDRKNEKTLHLQLSVPNSKLNMPISISGDKFINKDLLMSYNESTEEVMISGLYADESYPAEHEAANGIFSVQIANYNQVRLTKFIPFEQSFLRELTGKENITANTLFTFVAKNMIPLQNGGCLLLGESFYRENEEYMSPTFGMGLGSYRAVSNYHYNDVIAFLLDKEGNIQWKQILRKNQESQGDNGAYSSYALMNMADQLKIMFLESISSRTNLVDHQILPDGKTKIESVFSVEKYNAMPIMKLAKQVSLNTVVFPSLKGNNLKLVKVSYTLD